MSRGRGRGQLTFNAEALGIGRGDAPSSVLTPPPTYPPRMGRPLPLVDNADQDYLLSVNKRFQQHLRSSQFYLKQSGGRLNKGRGVPFIEPDSDQDDKAATELLKLDWTRFPAELRPNVGKRKAKKRKAGSAGRGNVKPKLIRNKDVTKALEALEKREKEKDGDDDDDAGEGDEKNDSDDAEEKGAAEVESDAEEPDEEMDDGTDYANNYFDNGESYADEEDDNMDEGAIY